MSAYAATARIDRVTPRIVVGRSGGCDGDDRTAAAKPDDLVMDVAVRDPLIDRLIAARERWTQLTFFLFNAESWR